MELCSALTVDGLTPSIGMLKHVRSKYPGLIIHVLIRPREGDFVYQEDELLAMATDIREALPWCDGFAGGALTADGHIDTAALRALVANAQGKPFTFHRAFDQCRNPQLALEQLIEAGCSRVLTSGQQSTAVQGIPLLRELCIQAQDRIVIMPGGGVNERNARMILSQTGATEIHGSASEHSGVTSAETVRRIMATIGE